MTSKRVEAARHFLENSYHQVNGGEAVRFEDLPYRNMLFTAFMTGSYYREEQDER